MAGPKRTRGFTLVELLVVITIIGMLVSLLLPAIQSAREAGRRNTCQNNMRNAVLALLNFEQNKKGFPGYAVPIQKANGRYLASWVVPILPYLERNDLYQNWTNPVLDITAPANKLLLLSQLNVLLCPSNPSPDLGDNPLHFVVNTGSARTPSDNDQISGSHPASASPPLNGMNWPEDANSGVFFDQAQLGPGETPLNGYGQKVKKVSLDYISTSDGTVNTLMMTENLQAGAWGFEPVNNTGFTTAFQIRQSTGFVWFLTGLANNAMPPTVTGLEVNAMGVNDNSKSITGFASGKYDSTKSAEGTATGIAFARPSASHPGGVNAAFCDGHMRFLNDELAYTVYTQLMTPFQKGVVIDYVGSVAPGNELRANATSGSGVIGTVKPWPYILSEADF